MILGMKRLKILTTESERKAFLHPVRSRILSWLIKGPMTITQIARELSVHPANLTHHFRKLEATGLIKLQEERDIGRVVERYYVAVARSFEIEQEATGANGKVLNFLKNDIAAAIPRLGHDDAEELVGYVMRARIDEKTYQEFATKLSRLVDDFSSRSKSDERVYTMNVSLYPHAADYGPLVKIQIQKPNGRRSGK
jgi:DNA-binding transcriptional ArsR family regulator